MGCCWASGQDYVRHMTWVRETEDCISASRTTLSPQRAFLYLTLHQGEVLHLPKCLGETLGGRPLGGIPRELRVVGRI